MLINYIHLGCIGCFVYHMRAGQVPMPSCVFRGQVPVRLHLLRRKLHGIREYPQSICITKFGGWAENRLNGRFRRLNGGVVVYNFFYSGKQSSDLLSLLCCTRVLY